jgi:hypothetical protein
MKVDHIKPPITGEPVPPRLLLQPESDKDRRTLDKIVQHADTLEGQGRDPKDGELIHVSLLLASKPE